MLREEAFRMLSDEAPKRPPMKLQWNEILAASLNPQLLPFIFDQKIQPYMDEMENRKSRMANLKTMLGILEPEKGEEDYTLGPGQVRYRDNEPVAAVGFKPDEPDEDYTLGPGQVRYRDREPIAAVGFKPEPAEPLAVGAGGIFVPEGVKGRIMGGPAGGVGGQMAVPERLWGLYLRNKVNPVEPGHALYQNFEHYLGSAGGRLDERIQTEGRNIYRNVYNQTLEGLTFGGTAKPEDIKAAEDAAAVAFENYVRRFQPPPAPPRGMPEQQASPAPAPTGPMSPQQLGLALPYLPMKPMPPERPRVVATPPGAPVAPGAPVVATPGAPAQPAPAPAGRPPLQQFLAQQMAAGKTKQQAFEAARQAGY